MDDVGARTTDLVDVEQLNKGGGTNLELRGVGGLILDLGQHADGLIHVGGVRALRQGLGVEELATRGVRVRGIVAEEGAVELALKLLEADLAKEIGQGADFIAGGITKTFVRHAGETFGHGKGHGAGVDVGVGRQGGALGAATDEALHHLAHAGEGLGVEAVAGNDAAVGLGGTLPVAGVELHVGLDILGLADLGVLLGGGGELDDGVVAVLDDLDDVVHRLTGGRGGLALGIIGVDVHQVVEGALTVALLGLGVALAEEEVLDALLVGFGLGDFGLGLFIKHGADKVAALRQGAHAEDTPGAVGVVLLVLLMDFHEGLEIVLDHLLGATDVAAKHLDVGQTVNGVAEVGIPAPDHRVGELLGILEERLTCAALSQLGLRQEGLEVVGTDKELGLLVRGLLHRQLVVRQTIFGTIQLTQHLDVNQRSIDVGALGAVGHLGEALEEGRVNLVRLFELGVGVVAAGELDLHQPGVQRVLVGALGDLLGDLFLLATAQLGANLRRLENAAGIGPLLLRGLNHRRGEVGITIVRQGINILDFGLQGTWGRLRQRRCREQQHRRAHQPQRRPHPALSVKAHSVPFGLTPTLVLRAFQHCDVSIAQSCPNVKPFLGGCAARPENGEQRTENRTPLRGDGRSRNPGGVAAPSYSSYMSYWSYCVTWIDIEERATSARQVEFRGRDKPLSVLVMTGLGKWVIGLE